MIASENLGHHVEDDFPEVRKIVDAGISSTQKTGRGTENSGLHGKYRINCKFV